MHVLAAAGPSSAVGAWAYLVVFAAAAAGYMGVPLIATAVIGAAAVVASQGELNIAAVLVAGAIGCEIGGLGGFRIGARWGRQLLEHPGPGLAWRKKAVAKGEAVYQKWGRAAVFITPSIVSGALDMKFSQFVVWNFSPAGVRGVGRRRGLRRGQGLDRSSRRGEPGMLIGGVAVATACIVLAGSTTAGTRPGGPPRPRSRSRTWPAR